MADLKAVLADLGYLQPQTLLQSGNAVFDLAAPLGRGGAAAESRIAGALDERLSVRADVFLRTVAEWNSVIAANPFTREAVSDPAHLVVMALKNEPAAADVAALQASISGSEIVRATSVSCTSPILTGSADPKLTAAAIERALGTRGTARNWNTAESSRRWQTPDSFLN